MSENAALMKEIARLTGSINNHKRQQNYPAYPPAYPQRGRGNFRARARGRGRGRARGNFTYTRPVKYNVACSDFTSTGKVSACLRWTNSGKCIHGLSCRYQHDPHHIALCKTALHGRECTDRMCTLSHDMNEHNAPLCTHFAKGRCTRDDCRFTHQSAGNTICKAFSLAGWCDNGAKCTNMHVFECPEFSETGKCTRAKCNLQHTLRAKRDLPVVATPEPEVQQPKAEKIDVSLLLEDLGECDSDASDEDGAVATKIADSNAESKGDNSESDHSSGPDDASDSSDAAIDPSDFDQIEFDSANDGESFIHI